MTADLPLRTPHWPRAAPAFRKKIHRGICSSLAPRLGDKSLAANIIAFMFMATKATTNTYQISHSEKFDNSHAQKDLA